MAGLSVAKIKDTVDGVFPIKTFCLALALLMITLLGTVGVHQIISPPVEHITLTGKTIATLEIAKKIEEQPIQTVPDEHAPLPEQPTTETTPTGNENLEPTHSDTPSSHVSDTAHPLTAADMPETTEPAKHEDTAATTIEDSIAGLSEETPSGYLPIIRESDGVRPFDAYKAPFKLKDDTKGIISLVMVDYGLSDKLAKNAIETLPAATTFVASPYSENLQAKLSGARSKGMEVWMGIPMQGTEDSTATNIGPNAILSGLTVKENIIRLNTHMGRATGYAGIAFSVKATFDEGSPDLRNLLESASNRGVGIAELEPSDRAISIAAVQSNAPYIGGNIWLDRILNKSAVATALAATEKASLNNGYVVAVFHPSLFTAGILAEWQKSLAAKHIQLAPLSYAIHISEDAPDKKPAPKEVKKEATPTPTEKSSHDTH